MRSYTEVKGEKRWRTDKKTQRDRKNKDKGERQAEKDGQRNNHRECSNVFMCGRDDVTN